MEIESESSGRGRLLLDPAKWNDDLRLLRMANRQRWKIDDDFKDVAMARLKTIVMDGDDEIALKAIAEARHMESQNQKDEHKVVDVNVQTRHDRLDAIAIDLGLDLGLIESASREASRSDSGDAINADSQQKRTLKGRDSQA
jgi:hypothetical protein